MTNPDVSCDTSVDPLLTDLWVFDQPTFAASLSVERRSGLSFEQFKLCHVVGIVPISQANGGINHEVRPRAVGRVCPGRSDGGVQLSHTAR